MTAETISSHSICTIMQFNSPHAVIKANCVNLTHLATQYRWFLYPARPLEMCDKRSRINVLNSNMACRKWKQLLNVVGYRLEISNTRVEKDTA